MKRIPALIFPLSMLLTQCEQASSNDDSSVNNRAEVMAREACTSLEFGGYSYELVLVGDNCWFAENLRTMHYGLTLHS